MDPAKNQEEQSESTFNQPQAVVVRREPERELVVWEAPSRPFRRRDKQFYVTTFAIAGIISLILLLAEGVMPVLLIISLMFLYYVLSTVEPEKVQYKVTSKGIKIAGKLTEWPLLNRFWFIKRFDSELIVFDASLIPGRIEVVLDPAKKENVKKEISAYIPFEEIPASNLDKIVDFVAKKLPGNNK